MLTDRPQAGFSFRDALSAIPSAGDNTMMRTVFRAHLKEKGQADDFALAPKMSELARSMPGYKSHKVFVAEDGERVTIGFVCPEKPSRGRHALRRAVRSFYDFA